MAFTRKMLEALGIASDQIELIMDSHLEVVNGLKADRDQYKAQIAQVDTTKDWKAEFEQLQSEYAAYKAEQGNRDSARAKESAFMKILSEIGIPEKYRPNIVKLSADEITGLELDSNGNAVQHNALAEALTAEWNDFIPTVSVSAHQPPTPQAAAPSTFKTRAEIFAKDNKGRYVLNEAERQAAIKNNLENAQKGF